MNIAIFADAYLPIVDGSVSYILSYTKELRKRGHRVNIVAPEYPGYVDRDTNVIRVKSIKAPFPPKYRLAIPLLDKTDYKDLKLDIIHSQSPFALGKWGIRVGRKLGIPVVNTYHTLYPIYINNYLNIKIISKQMTVLTEKYVKHVYNKCDLVIVPSIDTADAMKRYGVSKPVVVLPHGVDLGRFEKFNGDAFRNKYGIKKEEILLLTVSRLGREKNIDFLINALPFILEQIPNVRLVIVGEGVARLELENQVKKLSLGDKVIFTGFLNEEDLVNAFAAQDLFVFSSLTETLGSVLLESMSFYKPLVAIGEKGVLDVMEGEKQRGGLIAKNDINDFVEKVVKILKDKHLYNDKAKDARKRSEEMSSEKMTDKLLMLYEKLIKQR